MLKQMHCLMRYLLETLVAEDKPVEPAKPAPKKVVAVRGDDRPGMKKSEPVTPARGGKFSDRKPGDRPDSRGPRSDSRPDSEGDRGDKFAGRDDRRVIDPIVQLLKTVDHVWVTPHSAHKEMHWNLHSKH